MTVNELSLLEGFSPVIISDGDREIEGVYIGDLLSWVMGKARSGDAWITIMSNINTLAVATLTDVACVVLCESVSLDEDTLSAARAKGINVISTELSSYEAALKISQYK
ncbi:MAG: DRTGG domain-containing protein [Ruminococcus sp.]